MKYTIAAVIALSVFSTSVYASGSDRAMDNSITIAKQFCNKKKECINVLAAELDASYQEGLILSKSDKAWNSLISSKARKLVGYCDRAPERELCEAYRGKLMERFIIGLAGNDHS